MVLKTDWFNCEPDNNPVQFSLKIENSLKSIKNRKPMIQP